ncbi:hypothetical protein CYMTET_35871, partial [Cymbomonas tetramitiformis]
REKNIGVELSNEQRLDQMRGSSMRPKAKQTFMGRLAAKMSKSRKSRKWRMDMHAGKETRGGAEKKKRKSRFTSFRASPAPGQSGRMEPVERMVGTAMVMAHLQLVHVLKASQIKMQLRSMEAVNWEMHGQLFEWFLGVFLVMLSQKKMRGWYHRSILWNLIFLQLRDGSFEASNALATVLAAGDCTNVMTDNPTEQLDNGELQRSVPTLLLESFDTGDQARRLL